MDAIPPLKGGSGWAIPSPPAVWFPAHRSFVLPSIEDAERLQGFVPGWTEAALFTPRGAGQRWRLVGNAVSVPLAEWLANRLSSTRSDVKTWDQQPWSGRSWPSAGWGCRSGRYRSSASPYPVESEYKNLAEFLQGELRPLSYRAARGFLSRLEASRLRVRSDFVEDLRHYLRSHEREDKGNRRSVREQENGRNAGVEQPAREGSPLRAPQKRPSVPSSSELAADKAA